VKSRLGAHVMSDNKILLGRITGIPIVMDASLIILVVLYGGSYLTGGSGVRALQGVFIVLGGIGSILLHELAHAWAGRILRCEATHIELNGMGGLCFFGRARLSRADDIFVTLAGPAANLALWALFYWLSHWTWSLLYAVYWDTKSEELVIEGAFAFLRYVPHVLSTIATINIAMFVFNLMPAFPLDGGVALTAALSRRMGLAEATKTVAALGYIVCAVCVYMAVKGHVFMLVIAYSLFMANREAEQIQGRATWQRWD
jgi:Zn-dependent protease